MYFLFVFVYLDNTRWVLMGRSYNARCVGYLLQYSYLCVCIWYLYLWFVISFCICLFVHHQMGTDDEVVQCVQRGMFDTIFISVCLYLIFLFFICICFLYLCNCSSPNGYWWRGHTLGAAAWDICYNIYICMFVSDIFICDLYLLFVFVYFYITRWVLMTRSYTARCVGYLLQISDNWIWELQTTVSPSRL